MQPNEASTDPDDKKQNNGTKPDDKSVPRPDDKRQKSLHPSTK